MQCLPTKYSFFHLESKYSKSPKQKWKWFSNCKFDCWRCVETEQFAMISYLSNCHSKLLMLFDQVSKDTLHFETNLLYDLNYYVNYLNEVQKIPFYVTKIFRRYQVGFRFSEFHYQESHALSALIDWIIFKGEKIRLVSLSFT